MHINASNNFNIYPTPACPTQPLTFDFGNWGFAKYVFNYGDGHSDTTLSPNSVHSYTAANTYTASATAYNNCGKDTTFYKAVTINSSIYFPASSMSGYPNNVCPGETVNQNAPWGYPSYVWDMGDGTAPFTSQNSYVNYSYSTTGTYIAKCTVYNFCGADTVLHDTILVKNNPYFTCAACSSVYVNAASPSCPNSSVTFNTSSGFPWYKWKFGDGDSLVTSSYQASHTYTAVGTYNFSVKITNFCGIDTTIYNSVVIDNSVQVPNYLWLGVNPNITCPNQAVQFQTDNSYATYLWNFGDGFTANGTGNASHTYTSTGTFNVSVVVGNACGNTSTTQSTVSVDTSATFPSGMSMWYNPSPSSCPNSPVNLATYAGYASYKWDFGDGGAQVTTSTEQVSHTYSTTGNFQAAVTVTNACGKKVTVYTTAQINNSVAISWLDIYFPTNPACPGDAVIMNPQSGAGNGQNFGGMTLTWDYGDGSPIDTTYGTETSHTYSAGVYNVVLTATNPCGKTKTVSKLLTINNTSAPQLNSWNFGVMPNSYASSITVCPGDLLVFYFEGINPQNVWNFGDGSTGIATDVFVRSDGVTITTIKHAYTNAGTYNYTLTLKNNCNKTTSLSKSVNVSTGLLVSGGFVISPPSSLLGYTTCGLINFVAYGGKTFVWDFGDGNTLSTTSPTVNHSYSNAGSYTVKIIITNGCGNSSTYTQTLIVNGSGGTVLVPSVTSPTCHNGSNGSASVVVNGGQAPYTYSWTDAIGQVVSTNISANNLSSGSYNVNVIDNNGCAGLSTVNLSNPVAITLSLSATHSSCGGASGTATVNTITGGSSPYAYLWSNGQTTSVATGLSMGNYGVTITDANSCTSYGTSSVSENGATLSVTSTTSVTCNGGSNGAINISASGGTAPYAYTWSTGATTQNITGVPAGSYSVVV
ncbi:MAG TPA: PKD domain-containing protein, partial [Bacteroidia bacterium]